MEFLYPRLLRVSFLSLIFSIAGLLLIGTSVLADCPESFERANNLSKREISQTEALDYTNPHHVEMVVSSLADTYEATGGLMADDVVAQMELSGVFEYGISEPTPERLARFLGEVVRSQPEITGATSGQKRTSKLKFFEVDQLELLAQFFLEPENGFSPESRELELISRELRRRGITNLSQETERQDWDGDDY